MAYQAEREIRPAVPPKPGWPFYPAWILLTLLAVPVAFFLALAVLRLIISFVGDFIYVDGVRHITEDYLLLYVFVPLVGLVTGALQYALLRRSFPSMGWWVPATLGGWLLGTFLAALPVRLGLPGALWNDMDWFFLVLGLCTGAGQWSVLRQHIPRSGWWLPANLIGWGLLALVTPGSSMGQYGLFLLGLFPACATAAAFALLVRRASPAGPQAT
jgi:hypothetical protein